MILVCGAAGFVGEPLLAELAHVGAAPLRGLVRREFGAVRLRDLGHEVVTADVLDGRGLDAAVRGVTTLVYLVQTSRGGDVVARDLEAVQNTMLAARAAGVRRVVFLGHVAASEQSSSTYLVGRWAAELAVRQSGLDHVIVRAPMIVGRGGALFELLRRTGDRLPVVPLFGWRRTLVEPVALGDVVEALRIAALDEELDGRSLDICGRDRMTFGELLRRWSRMRGSHRLFVPLPWEGVGTTAGIAWALGPRRWRESRLLLATLREPQICSDPSSRFPLPRRPVTFREAAAAVLESPKATL